MKHNIDDSKTGFRVSRRFQHKFHSRLIDLLSLDSVNKTFGPNHWAVIALETFIDTKLEIHKICRKACARKLSRIATAARYASKKQNRRQQQ